MKNFKFALLAIALAAPGAFAGDCTNPAAPTLPDGGTASMEDMLAGQKAVKDFQAANLEYMSCVEKDIAAAEEATLKAADDKEKEAAQAAHQKALEAYNAAVSKEEEVAGQFNTEIREYKAANPG